MVNPVAIGCGTSGFSGNMALSDASSRALSRLPANASFTIRHGRSCVLSPLRLIVPGKAETREGLVTVGSILTAPVPNSLLCSASSVLICTLHSVGRSHGTSTQ